MKSKRIRVGDLVSYNKITNFGPGRVVKIIQMRTDINNFKFLPINDSDKLNPSVIALVESDNINNTPRLANSVIL